MLDIVGLSFFVGFLIFSSVSDLRHGLIPNKVIYPAMLKNILKFQAITAQ